MATVDPQQPAAVHGASNGRRLTMWDFYSGVSFVFVLAIVAYAFHRGYLTAEQRWLLSAFLAAFMAALAGSFTGGLEVKAKVGAIVVAASAGFAAWFLFPYLFPIPVFGRTTIVDLSTKDGLLPVDFTLTYRRPRQANGQASGVRGELAITDLPAGTTELEIIELKPKRLLISTEPKDGAWKFSIGNEDRISIPVRDDYAPLDVPSKESLITLISDAKLSQDDVVRERLDESGKKGVVFTITNNSGRAIAVRAYDCWWCYHDLPKGQLTQTSAFMDFADFMSDAAKSVEFKMFNSLKSPSGYFALFVDFDEHGAPRRKTIGIHNLYDPSHQELVVGVDQFNELTIKFKQ